VPPTVQEGKLEERFAEKKKKRKKKKQEEKEGGGVGPEVPEGVSLSKSPGETGTPYVQNPWRGEGKHTFWGGRKSQAEGKKI